MVYCSRRNFIINVTQLSIRTDVEIRRIHDHVNLKKSKNPKILWKWVGGSSFQLEIKKIGKHMFIHYLITFLGEHLNVNNVINALLCLCSCFYVQVFVLDFYIFLYLQGP